MKCEVCNHPQKAAIELQLRNARSVQQVADRYHFTNDTCERHRKQCMTQLPATITTSDGRTRVIATRMDPVVLFEEHDECIKEARALIQHCKGEKNKDGEWIRDAEPHGFALGLREWRGCLDQMNRMLGCYDRIDPRVSRAYASRIIEVVSHALEDFPEAKDRVLAAIDAVDGEDN